MSEGTQFDKNRRRVKDRRRFDDPHYKGIERRVQRERRGRPDQRLHKRHKARHPVMVSLYSTVNENTGQLVDISKGGLALRLMVCSGLPTDFNLLDLHTPSSAFVIESIPYKMVSGPASASSITCGEVVVQRFGLAFADLSEDQSEKLDYFLANYTHGNA